MSPPNAHRIRWACLVPACREVVLYFSVIDEVQSMYADMNAQAMGFTSIECEQAVGRSGRQTGGRAAWLCVCLCLCLPVGTCSACIAKQAGAASTADLP